MVTCCGFTVPEIAPDHLSKVQPASGAAVTSTIVPEEYSFAEPDFTMDVDTFPCPSLTIVSLYFALDLNLAVTSSLYELNLSTMNWNKKGMLLDFSRKIISWIGQTLTYLP